MNKEELLSLAKDPKFIPGIYNYCDRWCERCPFTSRCLNCTLVGEQFGDLESVDISNEQFWQKFSEVLRLTMDMIKDTADKMGIDIDAIKVDENIKKYPPVPDLIAHLSKKYASLVTSWFEANQYLYMEEKINRDLNVVFQQNDIEETEVKISDAVEIIQWYQYFIHVKLHRASDNEDEEAEYDGYPKDSDGSAKVALIGIDRSIASWKILLSHLVDHKTETIRIIKILENLCIRVEKHFPDARKLIRPGLDEPRYE